MLLRRAGFVATLAAGVGLLGASVHGMTTVDHELKLAAATPVPAQESYPEFVRDRGGRDCDKPGPERHHPEV
jgi:hypothetical protein